MYVDENGDFVGSKSEYIRELPTHVHQTQEGKMMKKS